MQHNLAHMLQLFKKKIDFGQRVDWSVGNWTERWRGGGCWLKPQLRTKVRRRGRSGEGPGHLQSTAETPISRVLNPIMLTQGHAMSRRLVQG